MYSVSILQLAAIAVGWLVIGFVVGRSGFLRPTFTFSKQFFETIDKLNAEYPILKKELYEVLDKTTRIKGKESYTDIDHMRVMKKILAEQQEILDNNVHDSVGEVGWQRLRQMNMQPEQITDYLTKLPDDVEIKRRDEQQALRDFMKDNIARRTEFKANARSNGVVMTSELKDKNDYLAYNVLDSMRDYGTMFYPRFDLPAICWVTTHTYRWWYLTNIGYVIYLNNLFNKDKLNV